MKQILMGRDPLGSHPTFQHGGNPWAVLEDEKEMDRFLDFSADLNPFGPPPGLRKFLQSSWDRIGWYPEPTYRTFRETVAEKEGLDPAHILPGNGTADLIHLISRLVARSQAVVVVPTFTEYERAVQADGGKVIPWVLKEEEGFDPLPLMKQQPPFKASSSRKMDLLFLCHPNNPTGSLWPREELLKWIEWCERLGITVVVDEAYIDLVEEPSRHSLIGWVKRFHRLIVLRSLTKVFHVPGLRIGYLAASPEMVGRLQAIQPPWVMNALAAEIGSRLVQDRDFLSSSREKLAGERSLLEKALRGVKGVRVFPSEANFFLCRVLDPAWSNQSLAKRLCEEGIGVRVCNDFTGLPQGRFIRVAVRRFKENIRLLKALQRVLEHAG